MDGAVSACFWKGIASDCDFQARLGKRGRTKRRKLDKLHEGMRKLTWLSFWTTILSFGSPDLNEISGVSGTAAVRCRYGADEVGRDDE